MKPITHQAGVSVCSGASHLVLSPVGVPQLDVLFVFDSVQVFVQPVQQEGQQLLTVVLLVAQKLRRKVAHLRLHTNRKQGHAPLQSDRSFCHTHHRLRLFIFKRAESEITFE